MTDEQSFDAPAVYEIRVHGVLNDWWKDWFEGLTIIPQADGETLLVGTVIDQAALHGVLDRLHTLNLPLISVCRVDESVQNDDA